MGLVGALDFGEFLISRGILTPETAARARDASASSGDAVHIVAGKLGLAREDDLCEAAAEFFKLPVLDAADLPESATLPERFSADFLRSVRALPVCSDDDEIVVALADPVDPSTVRSISFATERVVKVVLATPADIERGIETLYEADPVGPGTSAFGGSDLEKLRELASEKPVMRYAARLIETAAEIGASDIHLEPDEHGLSVRYRVDGALSAPDRVPAAVRSGLISRIKIMAELDIGERRLPQDGRASYSARGRPFDLRVATLPTIHGESIVLRLLDAASVHFSLESLGFSPQARTAYTQVVEQPHGITLVTGPTGSGKTTTLYASLEKLKSGNPKILTVEDPVEYRLDGIQQVQVHPDIGLTFAAALRSILRQDPDILMVGEVRDLETAEIAIQFALTGHPVLTTLHTNSAVSAVTRLLDMGVDRYLLTAAINGVVGQRLVRGLCPHCSVPDPNAISIADRLDVDLAMKTGFRKAVGCDTCRGTGFVGRTAILEVLTLTGDIRKAILDGHSEEDIERCAQQAGMRTMLQDGLAKAASGLTTLDEVIRVTRSNH